MLQAQVLNRSDTIDREEFLYQIQRVLHSAQRLAHGILRSPTEAEDVVQEAALKAWAKIGTFQAGTDFKSWFLKIVANECRQTMRSGWWKVVRKSDVDRGSGRSPQDQFVTSDGVRQALNQLGYDQRVVIVSLLPRPFVRAGRNNSRHLAAHGEVPDAPSTSPAATHVQHSGGYWR